MSDQGTVGVYISAGGLFARASSRVFSGSSMGSPPFVWCRETDASLMKSIAICMLVVNAEEKVAKIQKNFALETNRSFMTLYYHTRGGFQ